MAQFQETQREYNRPTNKKDTHEWFLSRVSILTRDNDIANLSVRLSVRLSETFRYQMKTA